MFVPLSHAPGHAQCDFGEARVIIGGVERKAHYLVLDLPHSDGCFVKAYPAETTEAFLDGRVSAFASLGGVPQSILYDNTKLAVARILGDGTLRATQPAALNDPFECAVATAYVFEDEAEEDHELAKVLTEINENKPISAIEVLTARIEYGSLFTRQLLSDQISTRFGIVSFTANPHHPLMWSLYTTDGSGFVIGYDMSQLRKLSGPVGELRAVQYNDQPPMFIGPVAFSQPQSNIPALLSLKSNHWSHEEEWRLIVELNKTVGTGQTDQHGLPINLVQIPNEAVVAVFYTERTPGQAVQRIRARLADPNNRYQAENPRKLILSSTSYEYEEAPDDGEA